MNRAVLIFVAALCATPLLAQDTDEAERIESCRIQSDVVAAIQQARRDRVPEREVQAHILAQDPDWPERFNNTIPLITPWVYEQKRRIIRREDLSAVWNEVCLSQEAQQALDSSE